MSTYNLSLPTRFFASISLDSQICFQYKHNYKSVLNISNTSALSIAICYSNTLSQFSFAQLQQIYSCKQLNIYSPIFKILIRRRMSWMVNVNGWVIPRRKNDARYLRKWIFTTAGCKDQVCWMESARGRNGWKRNEEIFLTRPSAVPTSGPNYKTIQQDC